MKKRVVIECSCGIVQAVYSNRDDIEVDILDWDEYRDPDIQYDKDKMKQMDQSIALTKVLKKIY